MHFFFKNAQNIIIIILYNFNTAYFIPNQTLINTQMPYTHFKLGTKLKSNCLILINKNG